MCTLHNILILSSYRCSRFGGWGSPIFDPFNHPVLYILRKMASKLGLRRQLTIFRGILKTDLRKHKSKNACGTLRLFACKIYISEQKSTKYRNKSSSKPYFIYFSCIIQLLCICLIYVFWVEMNNWLFLECTFLY